MPVQVFRCPAHGEFDINIPFSQDIPPTVRCKQTVPCCDGDKGCHRAYCSIVSPHVIKAPAGIVVQGGTGAGRGHTQARADSRFNETASLDPRSKAELQHRNITAEHKEVGLAPPKVDSEGIRKTAAGIAADNKRRPRGRLAGA